MKNHYKLIFALLFQSCLALTSINVSAQEKKSEQVDIDTLTHRLVVKALEEHLSWDRTTSDMLPDGSWKDINYKDSVHVQWPTHIQRLKTMSQAYRDPSNQLYNSEALLENILSGFDFIYDKKYKSWNWYDVSIGAPSNYMVALILLKNKISHEKLLKYATFLKDDIGNKAHQGQNRISVSIITIYKGCIENNFALINRGFASVASTLVIEEKQGVEGIKIDNSFHQHRPQLYSGGYGMGFVKSIAEFMSLSTNTFFADTFTPEKRKLFSDLLRKGHQLFGYRDVIDFGTIGRGISRRNAMGNIDSATLKIMMIIDPAHANDYKEWKNNLSGAAFSKTFQGNKYFWKSDIMTHHGANYYLSAKVISSRSVGTEMLNGENSKGYNLPLGATNITTTGKEYRNIFPVWDWTRVPGTTAVNNPSSVLLSWYLYGSNVFSGGISDGKNGAIAYDHSYNGVQAKKAYFFMDDAMLCLGSGINALGVQSVRTSVNQCFLTGDVMIDTGNNAQLLTEKRHIFTDLKWAYHDSVGYVFPDKANITIQKDTQAGSWKSISVTGSDSLVKKDVFSIWFNHGTAPENEHYSYIVIPGKSLADFKNEASDKNFRIVQNTVDVQAIRYKNYYAIIFYNPGAARMDDGLIIKSENKALVLLKKKDKGYSISVSDPVHIQSAVKLILNKKISGPDAAYSGQNTEITFMLPVGNDIGNSLTRQFSAK